jgi:hypothetical protein
VNGIVYFAPQSRYQDKYDSCVREKNGVKKRINLIGNLRLLVVAVTLGGIVAAYRTGMYPMLAGSAAAGLLLFVYLAAVHGKLFQKLEELNALIEINKQGFDRWSDKWRGFAEQGASFVDNDHPYTSDLDIFGRGSFFQHLCCARTYYGKMRLAELLKFKDGDAAAIILRQQAVDNLAPLFSWRQRLECSAFSPAVAHDPHALVAWAESGRNTSGWKAGKRLLLLLPLLTVAVALAGHFVFKSILPALPLFALQVVVVALTTRRHFHLFEIFEKYSKALFSFGSCLQHIEGQVFTAPHLQDLREEITSDGADTAASAALGKLASIVNATEARLSPLPWFLANVFLLWDFRCGIRLEQWQYRFGGEVRKWLACIGEFEALSSLALLRFDHPDWVFPQFHRDGEMGICAKGLGHPLLPPERRIVNDFSLGPPGGSIGIITGSNMSGKSTFLRSVGGNLVLAYAGAPVCAAAFTVPLFAVFTSMRTGDDLLSSTSTFYAELLRIKKIVDAAGCGQALLFLLDELFSGTNSTDRHDGAVTLLRELSRPYTLGLVSTHDLALCELAAAEPKYANYHFQEHYDGDELQFDFKLSEGPSTTRNALYLMRKVGIRVVDSESPVPVQQAECDAGSAEYTE